MDEMNSQRKSENQDRLRTPRADTLLLAQSEGAPSESSWNPDDLIFAQADSNSWGTAKSSLFWLAVAIGLVVLLASLSDAKGQQAQEYRISPDDVLDIRVFQEEDLNTSAKVSTDGAIALPLVGRVKVAGKNIEGAIQSIRAAYLDGYLVNPQVTILISEYSQRSFTILGQVNKPGTYTFQGSETVTLLDAIGKAGGYTRIADPGKIDIKRRQADGKESVIRINAKKNAREDKPAVNIQPGDVISVGESIW